MANGGPVTIVLFDGREIPIVESYRQAAEALDFASRAWEFEQVGGGKVAGRGAAIGAVFEGQAPPAPKGAGRMPTFHLEEEV